jgi:NADH dehydrogenase (ubiquinone) flavoprotein 2
MTSMYVGAAAARRLARVWPRPLALAIDVALCAGRVCGAPSVQECLTPETTIQVLEACKAGKPIPMEKWGSKPMNGQLSCEGPMGKTSLKGPQPTPRSRELKAKVDPVTVAKHMMYQ